jgi:hypothetical protein
MSWGFMPHWGAFVQTLAKVWHGSPECVFFSAQPLNTLSSE